jgi:hypothetical protein
MNTSPNLRRALRPILAVACAAAISLGSIGCAAIAVGAGAAGAVAYLRGDLQTTLAHPYENVLQAAQEAVGEMGFVMESESIDALTATYTGRTAADQQVNITVQNSGENLTDLRIRVGTFGDERQSRVILDSIRARL